MRLLRTRAQKMRLDTPSKMGQTLSWLRSLYDIGGDNPILLHPKNFNNNDAYLAATCACYDKGNLELRFFRKETEELIPTNEIAFRYSSIVDSPEEFENGDRCTILILPEFYSINMPFLKDEPAMPELVNFVGKFFDKVNTNYHYSTFEIKFSFMGGPSTYFYGHQDSLLEETHKAYGEKGYYAMDSIWLQPRTCLVWKTRPTTWTQKPLQHCSFHRNATTLHMIRLMYWWAPSPSDRGEKALMFWRFRLTARFLSLCVCCVCSDQISDQIESSHASSNYSTSQLTVLALMLSENERF